MKTNLSCFKAYDIRGRVPEDVNAPLACALGRAMTEVCGAKRVVLGRDARLSGPELRDALATGLAHGGAQVTDIGLCGTEEIYYAAANHAFDLGVMITGSHNPANENGVKIVRRGGIPVSQDSGLRALRDRTAELLDLGDACRAGTPAFDMAKTSFREDYVDSVVKLFWPTMRCT